MNISKRLPLVDKTTYLKIKRIMDISNGMQNVSKIIKTKGLYTDEFARVTAKEFDDRINYIQTTIGTSTYMIPTVGEKEALKYDVKILTDLLRPVSNDIAKYTKKRFPRPNILEIALEITKGFEKDQSLKAQKSIKALQETIKQAINDSEYKDAKTILENIFLE